MWLLLSVDEITRVLISVKKRQKKLKYFEKIVFFNKRCIFISMQNIGRSIPLRNHLLFFSNGLITTI